MVRQSLRTGPSPPGSRQAHSDRTASPMPTANMPMQRGSQECMCSLGSGKYCGISARNDSAVIVARPMSSRFPRAVTVAPPRAHRCSTTSNRGRVR